MNDSVVVTLPHHNETFLPNGSMVVETIWTESSLEIALYSIEEKQGYNGTLLKSKLISTAETLESDASDFMNELKSALCTANGLQSFTYHLSGGTFKLSKQTGEGLRITYGEIELVKSSQAVERILVNSIKSNETKQKEIDALRAEVSNLNDTYDCMKLALEKCVDEKVQMESVLLTKFTALLNEKKSKIVELEKIIKCGSSNIVHDYESDGSDSDLDYSTQSFSRNTSSAVASSSNRSPNNDSVAVVPKRGTTNRVTKETTMKEATADVEETKSESVDIYDRETEMMMCDM